MSKTYKTDPWDVKETRQHRPRSLHTRDLSKRTSARERREIERITRDLEAWESYYPTGQHYVNMDDPKDGWQY